MSWPDERVERLRKLWPQGLSCSEIAEELGGGLTRNAVIGKINRLGLKREKHAKNTPNIVSDKARKYNEAGQRMKPPATKPQLVKIKSNGTVARHFAPTPLPEEPPIIDASSACTLMDLRAHMCRWPLGDPREESFRFCGAHTHIGPYCPGHAAMAYARPDVRRDRALARLVVSNPPTAQAIRRGAVA